MLEGIKSNIRRFRFEYYLYKEGCQMENVKYSWLGYLVDQLDSWYKYSIAAVICKYRGHDFKLYDLGDAENGPRVHGECQRCGYETKTSYHG